MGQTQRTNPMGTGGMWFFNNVLQSFHVSFIENGQTPLHIAATNKLNCLKFLLEADKIDVNETNEVSQYFA